MKPIVSGIGLLIVCCVMTLSAQRTPAPAQQPAHNVYVLTGCLEDGTPEIPFKLTGSTSVGEPPPARASKEPGAAGVYTLQPISSVGEQGVNREALQSHVGKRVEVTIRPVEVSPLTSSSTAATDTKAKPDEQAPRRYTVIKINRLADSC
jgi:hypothetical protein